MLDPGLLRDLAEARGALARHGVVIVRTVETELGPALMAASKSSMESSPGKLKKLDDDDLDKFTENLRKKALDSAEDLKDLYVRLLAKLGTEPPEDIVKELEGTGQLFTWERILESARPVNDCLAEKGFGPIVLDDPDDLSDGFELELGQRWPAAFQRFRSLVEEAARPEVVSEPSAEKRQGQKPAKKAKRKE